MNVRNIQHVGLKEFYQAIAPAQVVTGAYVDLANSMVDAGPFDTVSFTLGCLVQDCLYKIMGSNDRTNWFEIVAEQSISADAIDKQEIAVAPLRFYKTMIKDAAGGAVGAVTFTGSGLDDMTAGITFTGLVATNYKVEIDGTGTPDTFRWSDDGGATWNVETVSITGSAQTLSNGVTITFAATTGHTLTDYWEFTCTPPTGTISSVGIAK